MTFIKTLIGLPILIIVLVFAFVNNDLATFSLWPFSFEIEVSLSVVVVVLVAFGFLLGSFFSWLSYAPVRKELRKHKKQNKKLSKEQEKLAKEVFGLQTNLEVIKQEELAKNPPIPFKQRLKNIFTRKQKKVE